MSHAGDVLGSLLVVYGGFSPESRQVLSDFLLYDIEEDYWIQGDLSS